MTRVFAAFRIPLTDSVPESLKLLTENYERGTHTANTTHGGGVYEIVVMVCYGNKENEWREEK